MVSYNSILGLDVIDGTYSSPFARKDKLHKEEAKNNVNSLFEFDTNDSNIYDTDGLCPFLEKTKKNVSRKSWLISLVIFTAWLSFVVIGGLLQIKGHHIQLEKLVEKQIMFGSLLKLSF